MKYFKAISIIQVSKILISFLSKLFLPKSIVYFIIIAFIDRYDGNIDTVANRISNVRTWSYVANKKNWASNADYWIERTKYIEDKLSNKLHEELTKSFVDKRISVLSRNLKQRAIKYLH